jgi:hypothetical protein
MRPSTSTPSRINLRRYPADARVPSPIERWIEQSEMKKRGLEMKTRLEGGGVGKPKPPLFPDKEGRHAPPIETADSKEHWITSDTADHEIVRRYPRRCHRHAGLLAETVNAAGRSLLNYVSRCLTAMSGVTMRVLRDVRLAWAWREGHLPAETLDPFEPHALCPLERFSAASRAARAERGAAGLRRKAEAASRPAPGPEVRLHHLVIVGLFVSPSLEVPTRTACEGGCRHLRTLSEFASQGRSLALC